MSDPRVVQMAHAAAAAVRGQSVADLALDLAVRPSPAGSEEPLARWLAAWLAPRTHLEVMVQPFGPGRANLVVGPTAGADLAIYGHLDTSLSGDPAADGPLTGRPDVAAEPFLADGVLWGLGMGVAKAPTAAGIVALLAAEATLRSSPFPPAARRTLGAMLVAGGTHRARPPWPARPTGSPPGEEPSPMAPGLRAALASGCRPGAVLSVKGGAPGLLWEEPGSLYLEVTLQDRYGPALTRPLGRELPGAAGLVGAALTAVARWRRFYLSSRADTTKQCGPDATVGAIETGLAAKPDLLGSAARLYLYVVTMPGENGSTLAAELEGHLAADRRLAAARPEVRVYATLPAGRTDPQHPLVAAVREAGAREWPAVTGWRGSTDGALLRAEGIPTVRAGPRMYSGDDPRVEGVALDELVDFARLWARAAVIYVCR